MATDVLNVELIVICNEVVVPALAENTSRAIAWRWVFSAIFLDAAAVRIIGVTVASTTACATVVVSHEIAVVIVTAPPLTAPVPVALVSSDIREMIEVNVEVPAWLAVLFIVVSAVVIMGPAGRDVTDVVSRAWAAAVVNIPRVTVASSAACAASIS